MESALYMAAEEGYIQVVEVLLDRGAHTEASDEVSRYSNRSTKLTIFVPTVKSYWSPM